DHVGDLEESGLVGLHAVAPPRVHDDDGRVGRPGHLDLDLPDANGLDDDPRLAGGVEDPHRLGRGEREPTEVAARRHRSDEHTFVGGVVLHADAVAEDRAAAERAARVDGEHADLETVAAKETDELVRERRLARPGRARDADGVRGAGAQVEATDGLGGGVPPRLDEGEQRGDRGPVAATGRVDERGGVVGGSYSEITSVIPGTRSMMMRSTPAFSVIIETGQVPQAPTRVTWTALSASMPLK